MAMFPSSKATHLSLRFYCPILFESAIPLPLFQTSLEIAAMTHNFTACLLLLFTLLFMEQLAQLSVAHPIFCGEHVFDYPFGFKNSGHGDLSLQVKCDYGHRLAKPVLNISGKEYYILQPKVLNNFSFHHTMTIIDKELRDNCDPSSNNYTELRSSSQFHIAHTHIDITLWGQCNREWVDLPDQTASLKCNPDWHYNFTAAVSVPEACKAQAVLPVKNSGGPVDDHQIRHGGFPIKLNVSKSCRDCQSSGGCCGYYKSSMQFHCRCRRHRQYPDRCPAEKPKNKTTIALPLGFSIGGVALVAAVILLLIYLKKRPFGVVLVEIISAKVAVDTSRNRNEIILAAMASDKIRRGVLDEILDPDLQIGMEEEVKLVVCAVAELAFRCLATDRDVRPDMKEVATRLEEIRQHQRSLAY
ncbi:hypothetical protein SUGI_0116660 [Cryptomeria japonica]|nr:hypothetical protein SUGI_0116660 [Cryptomeria japonica]